MLSYCLKCKKKKKILRALTQKFLQLAVVKQRYYQSVLYVVLKKSKFIKKQEAKGLLSNLGIRTPLSKIPLLRDVLF